MLKKTTILVGIILFTFSSCKKTTVNLSNNNYLVFGHFYGECVGNNCVRIFRLEETHLFADTKNQYPNFSNLYSGNYVKLDEQKFNDTKDLINYFPTDLLNEPNKIIGQPDAGDWGGLYIEYNYNGIKMFWFLDQMKTNVPVKYHNFIDKVNEKIKQLL